MKRIIPVICSLFFIGYLQPARAQISLNLGTTNPVLCSGQTLTLGSFGSGGQSTTATGGTPPYTFQWSGPNGFTSNLANPVISPVTTLNTGNYFVTVTDQTGPASAVSGLIGVLVNQTPPSPIISGSPVNLSHCNTVTLSTTPGPYFYSWASTLQNPIPGANGSAYQALQSGTYFLMAMDPLTLCQSISNPLTVTILGPKPALNDISGGNFVNCSGTDFWLTVDNISTGPPGNYFKITWGDGTFDEYQPSFPATPPSHHYLTTGVFTLQFMVTNAYGCTSTVTYTVYNVTAPAISLPYSGNQSQCDTLTVNFLIQGYENNHPSTTYTMYFGDGTSQVVTPSLPPPFHVSHLYTKNSCEEVSKSFTARIVASNACDSAIATITPIKVYKRPGTEFQLPQQHRCVGQSLTFQNTSTQAANPTNCNGITDYTWSWGDGTPNQVNLNSNGTPNGIHTYSLPGTYEVCLTAHGLCGDSVFCDSVCITRPVDPGFTMDTNTICAPDTVFFTDTTDLNSTCGEEVYQWTITYSNPGNCTSVANPQYVFVNNTSASDRNPAIRFNKPGIYSIRLSITNACNTYTSPARLVTVMGPPLATLSASGLPSPVCGSITLNPGVSTTPVTTYQDCYGSILTYSWNTDCGAFPNPDQPYPGALTCSVPGNHSISVNVENVCGNYTTTLPYILYPEPVADPMPDLVVCPGEQVAINAFTGSPANVTFTWTRTAGTIGLTPTSGSSNIPVFTAVNTTNAPLVVTFTVTPHANGCNGTPKTFTLTINPKPVITSIANQQYCNGETSPQLTISGTVAGAQYAWVNTETGIGLGASGNTIIPAFTAQNASLVNLIGTVTITSSYTHLGKTCTGTPLVYTIGVNPVPVMNPPDDTLICAGTILNLTNFSGIPTGLTYTWTNSNPAINLSASGTGNPGNFTPPASFTSPQQAILTVTPRFTVGSKSCDGLPETFTITVNPKPAVTGIANQSWCHEDTVPEIQITGTVSGSVYSWTNSNPAIGIVGPGQGLIPQYVAQNTGSTSISSTFTIIPVYTNAGLSCQGNSSSYTVLVRPSPVIHPVSDTVYCEGDHTKSILFSTNIPSGVAYNWVNTNSAIGINASGSGNILSFIAANTTAAPITGCITVTASAAGCDGPGLPFCISVNPSPHPSISGPSVVFSGTVAGLSVPAPLYSTYSWSSVPAGQLLTPANTQSVTTLPLLTPSSFYVTVTNAWGCDSTASRSITIGSPVFQIVDLSAIPAEICSGEAVQLNVQAIGGSGVYTYAWSSSPATVPPISGVFNPVVYPVSGSSQTIYTYSVTVSDGINTPISTTVTVLVNPNPAISIPPVTPICDSSALLITSIPNGGTPAYTYTWSGPPGSGFSSSLQNPYLPVANLGEMHAGTYSLTVTDSKNCKASGITNILIHPKPLIQAFSNSPLCDSTALTLTSATGSGTGPYAWMWTGPAGSGFTANTADTGIAIANLAAFHQGIYTLVVEDNNACKDTANVDITLFPKPQVQVFSDAPVCDSSDLHFTANGYSGTSPYTFLWTGPPGSGFSSTQQNPVIPNANLAAYQNGVYSLIIHDDNFCSDTITTQVILYPKPLATALSNSPICDFSTLSLNGSALSGTPPYSWTWAGPAGSGFLSNLQNTGITPAAIQFSHAGPYQLMVSDQHNCRDTATTHVNIHTLPDVLPVSSFTVCNGSDTPPVLFSGSIPGTTFLWQNNSPQFIGLNSSGSGNIGSFAAVNIGTIPVIATITVTPRISGCDGSPVQFTITVNPTPTVNVNPALPQTYCPGTATNPVSFSGSVNGTVYQWSYTGPDIGILSPGNGNIPSFAAFNNSLTALTTQFTVIPVYTNAGLTCPGPAKPFSMTVLPLPMANPVPDQEVCSGTAMTMVSLTGPVAGTNFSWNHTSPATGMPYPGSFGSFILPYVLTNPGQQIIYDTVTIFPSITLNGKTCAGPDTFFVITLNTLPELNPVSNQILCAGDIASHVIFTGYDPTTSVMWSNSLPTIGLSANGAGNIPPFIAENSSLYDNMATVTAYPYAHGCPGPGVQFTITVKPVPGIDSIVSQIVCDSQAVAPIVFTGPVWNTVTYNWINLFNTPVGLPQNAGTSVIPGFVAVNAANNPVTATFRVTPVANGCSGSFREFTLTVNPRPQIDNIFDQVVCSGTAMLPESFDNSVAGSTYFWTNNHPEIGIPASGNGNLPAYILTNNTLNPVTATITVSPTAQTCTGAPNSFTLTVLPKPQVIPPSDLASCPGDTILLTWNGMLPGTQLIWSNSNNSVGFPSSGSGDIPAFAALNSGQTSQIATVEYYPMTLTGTLQCQGDTGTVLLTIHPAPVFTTSSSGPICDSSQLNLNSSLIFGNGPLNYSWTGPPGSSFTSSYENPIIPVASLSQFNSGMYTLTISDANNCQNTDSVMVTLYPRPYVWITGNTGICEGQVLNLTGNISSGTPAFSWLWEGEPGTAYSAAVQNPQIDPATLAMLNQTQLKLQVTDSRNCSNTAFTTLVVYPKPSVVAASNSPVCDSSSISLTSAVQSGTGPYSYQWTGPAGSLFAANTQNPVIAMASVNGSYSGDYQIIVSDYRQCRDTAVTTIVFFPSPTMDAIADQSVCSGSLMTPIALNSAIPGTLFNWTHHQPAIGLPFPGSSGTIISPYLLSNPTQQTILDTVIVIPSVYLNGALCEGEPEQFIITLYPEIVLDPIPNQSICAGSLSEVVPFTSPDTGLNVSWVNSNPSIGLPATGNGPILPFVCQNTGLFDQVAVITVYPTSGNCDGITRQFSITVKPSPRVDSVVNIEACHGQLLTPLIFTGPVWNTGEYEWTNLFEVPIGLPSHTGLDSIPGFTATNTTNTTLTATFSVIPVASGCPGTARTFTISVKPEPHVDNVFDQVVCAGSLTQTELFDNNIGPQTNFTWNHTHPEIGIPVSGSGNLPAFTAVNNTFATISSEFIVTPSADGCFGPADTFRIAVFQKPVANPIEDLISCPGQSITVTPSSPQSSCWFNWTNSATATGLAASGSGIIGPFTTLNSGNSPLISNIRLIPHIDNGPVQCTGDTVYFTITINPAPSLSLAGNNPVCDSSVLSLNSTVSYGTPPYNYQWAGPPGSGFISLAANPVIQPVSIAGGYSGTYTLTITDNSNCAATASVNLPIHPKPQVSASNSGPVCDGGSLSLTAGVTSGSPGYSWNWTGPAGSGAIPSIQNPTLNPVSLATFNQGIYRLIVSDQYNCKDTAFTSVMLNIPAIAFSGNDTTICETSSLYLGSSNAQHYSGLLWTTSGSGSFSNAASLHPSYTPAPADILNGQVSLHLTVSGINPCGAAKDTLVLRFYTHTVAFAGENDTICEGLNFMLMQSDTTNATMLTWSTSGTGSFDDIHSLHPVYTPGSADVSNGFVDLCMAAVNQDYYCGDSIHCITLYIKPLPNANAGLDHEICVGDSAQLQASGGGTYLWSPSSSLTNKDIANPIAFPVISTRYFVEINLNGCLSTDSVFITVNPLPSANAGPDQTICKNDSANLTASGGNSYAWSTGVNNQSIWVSPSVTTLYLVSVTDQNTCSAIDTVTVVVNPLPEILISPENPVVCRDSLIHLTASGASGYVWSPEYALISGNTSNPLTVNPLTNVVYHVTGTDDLGCKSDASVFVKVVNSPEIHLPDQAYLCPGAMITLNAGANDSTTYYWMGLPSEDAFLMVSYPGLYWVEARNEGCAVSDTTVVDDGTIVWFPNAFTPFDDNGVNDVFVAKSNTPLLSYHLFIFNRWGGLVFETRDITHGWDGTFEGKRCMGGLFVYKVIYTASHLCDDNKTTNDYHTGTIMLLE